MSEEQKYKHVTYGYTMGDNSNGGMWWSRVMDPAKWDVDDSAGVVTTKRPEGGGTFAPGEWVKVNVPPNQMCKVEVIRNRDGSTWYSVGGAEWWRVQK